MGFIFPDPVKMRRTIAVLMMVKGEGIPWRDQVVVGLATS
jgi:hypothetical protein